MAWNYDDGGDCSDKWRSFDNLCSTTTSADVKDICDTVGSDYWNCVLNEVCESNLDGVSPPGDGVSPPGEDCYYSAAFMYEEESACKDAWSEWDLFCNSDEPNAEEKEKCDKVNSDYYAAT